MTKFIDVYASLGPEYLYNLAIEQGFSAKAADYFRHFEEVPLRLLVDTDTGNVIDCECTLRKEG